MAVGYIYVLSNPSMHGLLKIGFTCADVERRARELTQATGVPSGFVVEYFRLTDDVEEIERAAHTELDGARVNGNREFFRSSIKDAVELLERLVRAPTLHYIRPEPGSSQWSCRRCGHEFLRSEAQRLCPQCGF
jgi:hypothetical protein